MCEVLHNTTSSIPINVAIVDSLKLRIPKSECEIVDKNLISETSIYYHDTEELDCEVLPPAPYKIVIDGITFRIHIVQIPIYNEETHEREPTQFLEVVLTSKLLRERYFEGINKTNLRHFYDTFMSYNVFWCEYETFINSQVSDIDICINRYAESTQAFVDIIENLYFQSGTKQKYLRKIIESNTLGLVFNSRTAAKPSLPFIKVYHKELELHIKSADFYNNYLFPEYTEKIKGLTRVEATIRNALHKRRLYKHNVLPEFKTLNELVNIEEIELRKFVVFSITSYVKAITRKKAPNLSPTDHIIFELMQNCVLKGYDFETILSLRDNFKGTSDQVTANARSRMKTKLTEIFDLLIHKDFKIQAKEKHNNHVIEYLKFFGIKI